VIDEREVFERSFRRYEPEGGSFERLVRRRDRKRRNQRSAAGAVGIVVFVVSLWTVSSVALQRGPVETSPPVVVPGGTVPSDTGPRQTAPPAHASAGPDVVEEGPCSDDARWRLVFTDMGTRIQVRFEVHRSPVGHEWLIHFRHVEHSFLGRRVRHVFFRGTAVASDSGVFVFQFSYQDYSRNDGLKAKAVDRQTGQVCDAFAWYRD
jgi:hypothetical protein